MGQFTRNKNTKSFFEALGMRENDVVELSRVDDNIVIKKVKNKNELTLDDIFKNYDGEGTAEELLQ